MAILTRLLRSRSGAEVVEMALVTPLLLFLMLGIVEGGFMFQRFVVLTNAAAEGARTASLPGYGTDDGEARAQEYATTGGVPGTVTATAVGTTVPATGGGAWPAVQVTVTHAYSFNYIAPIAAMFSGTLSPSVTLTARSTMRRQVAGGGS